MKANYPPVETTEERFSTWNPLLEIHPQGMEDMEVEQVVNPKETPWPAWEDHWKCEKKILGKQAEANRARPIMCQTVGMSAFTASMRLFRQERMPDSFASYVACTRLTTQRLLYIAVFNRMRRSCRRDLRGSGVCQVRPQNK
jgi:hypothetical protein